MLNYMRRHAQGATIKILFWIIIAVFILWGVGSFTGSDSSYAASVNGEAIGPKDVRRMAQQLERFYRQLYGENLTPEMVKALDFKNRALDQMINAALLKQEARRLGFSVTDEEVRVQPRDRRRGRRAGVQHLQDRALQRSRGGPRPPRLAGDPAGRRRQEARRNPRTRRRRPRAGEEGRGLRGRRQGCLGGQGE